MAIARSRYGGAGKLSDAAVNILLALAGGERHGYDIIQTVTRDTGARLGPTTLYRTIRTLVEQGLVEESDQRPAPELDDQRRRYYRLTAAGVSVAAAEVERLRRLLALAERTDGRLRPARHGA